MTRIYNYGDIDERILKYANAYIKQVVNNSQKNYFRDKLKHTRFDVSFEEYNDNINYNMNEINEFKIYLQFFEINKKRINIESKILYDGIMALTTKQREVLLKNVALDIPMQAVAKQMGVSLGRAYKLKRSAIRVLKGRLEKYDFKIK